MQTGRFPMHFQFPIQLTAIIPSFPRRRESRKKSWMPSAENIPPAIKQVRHDRLSRFNIKLMLLSGLCIIFLAACGTTAPTRFYLLSPVADPGNATAGNDRISIALATVELSEHLNRPQIVTRQEGHQVGVDEFNRWAEPLETGFTTALAENLSVLLGTDRIFITNRVRNTGFDYQIAVKVLRFDGWPGGEATLNCLWELHRGDAREMPHPQRFTATKPVEGDDYPDLVAALSGMLADLSREIADEISSGR